MLGILPVFFTAAFLLVRKLMSQAGGDFLAALRALTQNTVQWRQNAIRVNKKDGEKSELEYVESEREGRIVRRR